jgi:L-ascorbate metabolism protein UlaG (beta-lactamase superfamily)
MKIKWIGHSCFLVTAGDGTRVILDPYKKESHLDYIEVRDKADIVTVSHDHFDHNHTVLITGHPDILKGAGKWNIKGISIRGISAWHDDKMGRERGNNTIFCLELDGVRLCHLGDIGHLLNQTELKAIGAVDVLMLPVGGIFTIDAAQAGEQCVRINPMVAIPMHYKTDRCSFLQYTADDFAMGKPKVKRLDSSEVEIIKASMPTQTEVIILQYSR